MSDLTTRQIAFFTGVLVVLGAGWGITLPLTKIAVSSGHGHFGAHFLASGDRVGADGFDFGSQGQMASV